MLFRSVILFVLTTASASANPWPRDTENTFFSLTEDFGEDTASVQTSLFVEHGSPEYGLSIGISSYVDTQDDEWEAFAFVRQPLSAASSPDRVSVSAGIGAQQDFSGSTEPLLVLGGAWGRDVEGLLQGWLSLEGEARYATETGETELLGDATVAVEPIDRIALVNEFSLSGVPGSDVAAGARLTSSIVGEITDSARLQLGATVDLSGNSAPGFRVGTWLEF